jgi:hypothetical protein
VVADALFVAAGTATSLSDALGYRLARSLPVVDAGVRIARDSGRDFYGNPLPATRRRTSAPTRPAARAVTRPAPRKVTTPGPSLEHRLAGCNADVKPNVDPLELEGDAWTRS